MKNIFISNHVVSANQIPALADIRCQMNARGMSNARRNGFKDFHNVARQIQNLPDEHYLGAMDQECEHCGALKFTNEKFHCCHNGKVALDQLFSLFRRVKKSANR